MWWTVAGVAVFAGSEQADVVAWIRSGGREADGPYAACLASGLGRLPALSGVSCRAR